MYRKKNVSAVIPAFNEALAIGKVVEQLMNLKDEHGLRVIDEVLVCDNGSTDNTAHIAALHGAKVVKQVLPGYGIACLTSIRALAPCDIVLFVDGDDSCFVEQAIPLIESIASGNDLAIGSRVLGKIQKGALTKLQRFGNALSAVLIKIFWGHTITDLGPFRAINSSVLKKLDMQDKTFGWTVEMQIKAIQLGFKISEHPVNSKIRIGKSKISGTLSGSMKAGIGILTMIAKLRWQQRKMLARLALRNS